MVMDCQSKHYVITNSDNFSLTANTVLGATPPDFSFFFVQILFEKLMKVFIN
jgi:hypothetical protein